MESHVWWVPRLWLIALQVAAIISYVIGSRRFYYRHSNYFVFISVGIVLDIIIGAVGSLGFLPNDPWHGVPITSFLFIAHIVTAGFGLFGFIAMLIFIAIKGTSREYSRLRVFQYRALLLSWCLGVSIALSNFVSKAAFGIRLYDIM